MQWIDIGVNLTHESFTLDRDAVIERARAAGVTQMMVTGADLASSTAALQLAQSQPRTLFATAGVHPHHAASLDAAQLPQLRALLAQPEVVAAGECGLDYYRDLSPRAAQLRAFEWQLELALECGKPLFLHQRDAHHDFLAVLRACTAKPLHGVAHCFTGGETELDDYLALGLSIGIAGWFSDERRGRHLAALVRRIPTQRLLLETDAPYLLPRDLRPQPAKRRNEPMYLPHIGAAVAAARGESSAECAAHTTAHARALFGLPAADLQRHGDVTILQ
jgi:TatD DNase family protein